MSTDRLSGLNIGWATSEFREALRPMLRLGSCTGSRLADNQDQVGGVTSCRG
jgi:hypothetical protein